MPGETDDDIEGAATADLEPTRSAGNALDRDGMKLDVDARVEPSQVGDPGCSGVRSGVTAGAPTPTLA